MVVGWSPVVANLIGDGLQIQYIATSGTQGNINAKTLTKILSPSSFKTIGDDIERSVDNFTLFNAGSIVNGKDPETINEMYEVRSQYIHHGKELGITTEQISRYSGNVYCTLARLIQLRKEYKTIKEILSVVDNKMMGILF